MRFRLFAAALPIVAILSCSLANAQSVRTIRVTGSGAVSASPNQVTIRGTLTASDKDAEKTAEKFAKLKETFAKALGADKHPELALEFAGEKVVTGGGWADAAVVAAPADFGVPVEAAAGTGQYAMSEEVLLRIAIRNDMEREGISKRLSALIEAAPKAGLTLGATPNPMFAAMGMGASGGITQFELDDKGQRALRVKAYAAAMSDARARAATLADLSGGKLGKVISVEESAAPESGGDLESMQMAMLQRMFGGAIGATDGGIDHNGLIEFQQNLVVTFELVE